VATMRRESAIRERAIAETLSYTRRATSMTLGRGRD
jgi:hypothetical protein